MVDFHSNQKLSRALERFKRDHPKDYETVEAFAMDLLAQGISELRVRSYVIYLSKILDLVGKRFEEFTRDDIRRILAHYQVLVNKGERSESSIFEAKKTLKKVLQVAGEGGARKLVQRR